MESVRLARVLALVGACALLVGCAGVSPEPGDVPGESVAEPDPDFPEPEVSEPSATPTRLASLEPGVFGCVVDGDGAPVVGTSVEAFAVDLPIGGGGMPGIDSVGTVLTDENGCYLATAASAGAFLLLVGDGEQWARAWFPGVSSFVMADALEVNVGLEVETITVAPATPRPDPPSPEDVEAFASDVAWVAAYAEIGGFSFDEAVLRTTQEGILTEAFTEISPLIDQGVGEAWMDPDGPVITFHVRSSDERILTALQAAADRAGVELVVEGSQPLAHDRRVRLSAVMEGFDLKAIGLAGYFVDEATAVPVLDVVMGAENPRAGPTAMPPLLAELVAAITKELGVEPRIDWAPPGSTFE